MPNDPATPRAFSAEAFGNAIDALRARHKSMAGELTIGNVAVERDRFAAALHHEVKRGRYVFEPAHTAMVRIEGREREVFRSTVLDAVTERVVGRWLQEAIEPALGDALWSYRAGRSNIGALRAFGEFIRAHVRSKPNPKSRGLYVFRRDVSGYGRNIPSQPDSRLWTLLKSQLGGPYSQVGLTLLRQLVHRRHIDAEGQEQTLSSGSPTGSPIQPSINNLYLTPLDVELEALPGHYARFGDDILFASEDREVAQRARTTADAMIAELGLNWNADKSRDAYFNGAGRENSTIDTFAGSATVETLGYELTFRGTIRLPRRKLRALLETIRGRVRRTARLNMASPRRQRAEELVGVVRSTLDRTHVLRAPELEALHLVDDRDQLAQLDYLICLTLAQLCSGRKGPRAFRDYPPARLRDLGLPSLVRIRNGCGP